MYMQYYIQNEADIMLFYKNLADEPETDKVFTDVFKWLEEKPFNYIIDLEKTPPQNPELFIKCVCLYKWFFKNIKFISHTQIQKL